MEKQKSLAQKNIITLIDVLRGKTVINEITFNLNNKLSVDDVQKIKKNPDVEVSDKKIVVKPKFSLLKFVKWDVAEVAKNILEAVDSHNISEVAIRGCCLFRENERFSVVYTDEKVFAENITNTLYLDLDRFFAAKGIELKCTNILEG